MPAVFPSSRGPSWQVACQSPFHRWGSRMPGICGSECVPGASCIPIHPETPWQELVSPSWPSACVPLSPTSRLASRESCPQGLSPHVPLGLGPSPGSLTSRVHHFLLRDFDSTSPGFLLLGGKALGDQGTDGGTVPLPPTR